jgi:hypothetical protein
MHRAAMIAVHLALPLALLALVAAPASAAWPHDPNINVALSTAADHQIGAQAVSDGAGGAIVAWLDHRAGNYDVYAQRISSAGVPLWTANGVAVCTAANDQGWVYLIPDGAGGAILTWNDTRTGNLDVYAQRLNASGTPQWTANGVVVSNGTGDQGFPALISDGAGGIIVTFYDTRTGSYDIAAQRLNGSGAPQWAANGVAICTSGGDQYAQVLCPDGAGGAIIAWQDLRNSGVGLDIFAQRVNAAGVVQWPANGTNLSSGIANDQANPRIIADGAGGAIVAWIDHRNSPSDVYANRVSGSGTVLWPLSNGSPVSTAGNSSTLRRVDLISDGSTGAILAYTYYDGAYASVYAQRLAGGDGSAQWGAAGHFMGLIGISPINLTPAIIPDGSNGAIIAWHTYGLDIMAQRTTSSGTVLWGSSATAICTADLEQSYPCLATDGAGGAIAVWADLRGGSNYDLYAQRIEHNGKLGNPEPSIASVRDVAGDQGGTVKVSWNASYLDADPDYEITSYRLWRSAPAASPAAAARTGAGMAATNDPDLAAASHRLLVTSVQATNYYWESVGLAQAAGLAGYSLTAPTTTDSVSGSNPRTAFMVEAMETTVSGTTHWFSAPDSGYSVDNLAPATPTGFQGQHTATQTWLLWDSNSESDLAGYRLYRGTSAGFSPGAGNLVATLGDPGWVDPSGLPYYYKLTAIDVHGNESSPTTLLPGGTSDVDGGALPAALALGPPMPNPVRSAAGAFLRLALPRAASVRLSIYDATGREMRRLANGTLPAGEHALRWDARDAVGRPVPPGLYLIRLVAGHESRDVRAVVLD